MSSSQRIQIAFVSPFGHFNAMSGARARVTHLCSAFKKLGVTTACLSPWQVPDASVHKHLAMDGNAMQKLKAVLDMNVSLRRLQPAWVISESPLVPLISGGAKVVHMIHDAKFLTNFRRRAGNNTTRVHRFSSSIAARTMTVSNAEKARLTEGMGLDADKIIVSYNGVTDQWLEAPSQPVEKSFDLLYVSNFAKHKGHMDLIKALAGSNLKLALVGSDFGVEQEIRSLCERENVDVHFFSQLDDATLIDLYDRSRLFVFPSQLEGFGIPFIEARARQLPVVANDIPVFRELAESVGGTTVDCKDPTALRIAIDEALSTSTQRHETSVSALGWTAIAERMLKSLRAIN